MSDKPLVLKAGAFELTTTRLADILRGLDTRSHYGNNILNQAAKRLEELEAANQAQAQELVKLNEAMDAVGAGGVETLRTAKIAPTNAHIAVLKQQFGVTSNGRGVKEFTNVVDFVREALRKWGTPVSEDVNAKRYKVWRDAMVAGGADAVAVIAEALPVAVGESRRPTPDEWDAAMDAIIASKGKDDAS